MVQQQSASPYLWALRITALIQAALIAVEFLTAGHLLMQELLGEELSALPLHAGTALAVHVAGGAQVLAAVLLMRPGNGPAWPAVVSAAAFGTGFAQAYFGSHVMLALHVPAALLLVVLVMIVLVGSWLRPLRDSRV
ncbi:hypothetical protein LP52_15905 [Streptomonospora alba]|uniref:Integral membrane protein n=1 Tax=Streptomonospora alba TaxID=183763 RepID=A0A0C2G413_9ACTN|nr:hypothetical protein [Streptomonospora alba]KIH98003.1 hypothetical protein LP52_15905 [Streptomonospora alba]